MYSECSSPAQRSLERSAGPAKPALIYLIGRYFVERTGHRPFDHRVMQVERSGRFVVVGVYNDSQAAWHYAQELAASDQAIVGRHLRLELTDDELSQLRARCENCLIAGPPQAALDSQPPAPSPQPPAPRLKSCLPVNPEIPANPET